MTAFFTYAGFAALITAIFAALATFFDALKLRHAKHRGRVDE